jgi:outer membrane protein OmpA-like peptidoglycan-associated protein
MDSMKPLLLASTLVLGIFGAACSEPLPPTQSAIDAPLPDSGPTHTYKVNFPDEGPGAMRYIHISLGEDMARDCGLVQTHFEFDSAEPLPQDKVVLQSLAACLDRPKYADVQVSLVGRADRRGTPGYNEGLALRRAERVKKLLVDYGMTAGRIRTASDGARDAVGGKYLEFSYGYDRRVDAKEDVTHAPAGRSDRP